MSKAYSVETIEQDNWKVEVLTDDDGDLNVYVINTSHKGFGETEGEAYALAGEEIHYRFVEVS